MRVTSEFESHSPHMMQLTQPRELEVERQCRYQVALGDLENAIKEPELEPWFERVTERGPKTFEAMCLLLCKYNKETSRPISNRSSAISFGSWNRVVCYPGTSICL